MTPQDVESRLDSHPEYPAKFKEVFNEDSITFEQVRNAIGAYERTLLTRGAYDRFLEGDDNAISAQAKRGMTLFLTKGCKGCHSGMSVGGQSLQKFPLRRYVSEYIGLWFEPDIRLREPFPLYQRGRLPGEEQRAEVPCAYFEKCDQDGPLFS